MDRVFGIETEYAFSALGRSGDQLRNEPTIGRFLAAARKTLPHLGDGGSDSMFLATGGRLYRDRYRLELTTPETSHPDDTCRYLLANDRILARVAQQFIADEGTVAEVVISRSNVSYGSNPTTSGCHESYACRTDLGSLSTQLIPFLASRLIFTGAGGFNNLTEGIEFSLSPRVYHLTTAVSASSTEGRGIFHMKMEPLGPNGSTRLHVLVGESLCSEAANWLKVAVTAAVVAMVDGGLRPGDDVQLKDPLRAMRNYAADVDCLATAELADGRQASALDIQLHYLQLAEAHQHAHFMPPWAPEACRRWREILDRLQQGQHAVATMLDWAIKSALYTRVVEQHGFSWAAIRDWHYVLKRVGPALRFDEAAGLATLEERLAHPDSRTSRLLRRLTPYLTERGLRASDLRAVLRLRGKLFELDTRFSQVGDQGIFAILERGRLVDHHVPGVDRVEHAMSHPPENTRAALRGRCVLRFAGANGRYRCGWTAVWDREENKVLDLTDPLTRDETWRVAQPDEIDAPVYPEAFTSRLLREIEASYASGQYEAARGLLDRTPHFRARFTSSQTARYYRLAAWVQCRRGYLDGPTLLDFSRQFRALDLELITDYVFVYRFEGFAPVHRQELMAWIERGRPYLDPLESPSLVPGDDVIFREHWAAVLLHGGDPEAALRVLAPDHRAEAATLVGSRIYSRVLVTLADTHRVLGNRRQAHRLMREAFALLNTGNYRGELADFALTTAAKLERRWCRARTLLAQAKSIQTELRNCVGEARTLLLEARLSDDAEVAAAARSRVEAIRSDRPALAACALLQSIFDHWDAWVGGDPSPQPHPDSFWGL